jgi:hypothetical protein
MADSQSFIRLQFVDGLRQPPQNPRHFARTSTAKYVNIVWRKTAVNAEQPAPATTEKPRETSAWINTLSIILAVLFVFFGVTGLIGTNLRSRLFDPSRVKQTLAKEISSSNVAPPLLQLLAGWRAEQFKAGSGSAGSGSMPDFVKVISYIDMESWWKIKHLLIPDEFVNQLVSTNVDGFFRWLDSTDIWPEITVDAAPIKERIGRQQGVDAIMVVYASLPECSAAEIADFKTRLSNAKPGTVAIYNLCQFPSPYHDDQVRIYVGALNDVNANIPAQINLRAGTGKVSFSSSMALIFLKEVLKLARTIGQWSWLVPVVLLLVIAAIRVRSLRSLGQFVGIPLALVGALTIITARVGQASLIGVLTTNLQMLTKEILWQYATGSLTHLFSILLWPLPVISMFLEGLGMGLIVLPFIRRA